MQKYTYISGGPIQLFIKKHKCQYCVAHPRMKLCDNTFIVDSDSKEAHYYSVKPYLLSLPKQKLINVKSFECPQCKRKTPNETVY